MEDLRGMRVSTIFGGIIITVISGIILGILGAVGTLIWKGVTVDARQARATDVVVLQTVSKMEARLGTMETVVEDIRTTILDHHDVGDTNEVTSVKLPKRIFQAVSLKPLWESTEPKEKPVLHPAPEIAPLEYPEIKPSLIEKDLKEQISEQVERERKR